MPVGEPPDVSWPGYATARATPSSGVPRAGRRAGRRPSGVVGHGQVPRPARVHGDAGTHRRRHGDLLDVAALGRGRLRAEDLVESCPVVLDELVRLEAGLADDQVEVRLLVDAE